MDANSELSTPQVIVDGETIAVVPNSVVVRVPGEAKVRAMSIGGGAIEVVTGLDASTLIGHVKFEIPSTRRNADRVLKWKQKMKVGEKMTVNIVFPNGAFPHQQMSLTKDTEIAMKSDGNIPLEFEGQPIF